MTVTDALNRYLTEVSPTKRPASAASDARYSKPLIRYLGKYSLVALTPEILAKYRDDRLASLDRKDAKGKPDPKPRPPNTVRLDLALLGHMFNTAIKEWGTRQVGIELSVREFPLLTEQLDDLCPASRWADVIAWLRSTLDIAREEF